MNNERCNIDLRVGFIGFDDDETDIGLSFAIYDNDEYTSSIMLARSSFDRLLPDAEQGVMISYDEVLDSANRRILLQAASIRDSVIELTCDTHRFTLNLTKIDASDIEIIKAQLIKLNYDNRFKLSIDGEESEQNLIIAFCWYQPDEWAKLKQLADDAESLDDTYKDWKKNANNMIQLIQSAGRKVQKINVKIEELEAWCKTEGKANNSNSRSKYATEMAQRRNNK